MESERAETSSGDKPVRVREANRRVTVGAAESGVSAGVPLLCECSDPACGELIVLTLVEVRHVRRDPARFVTLPEHRVEGAFAEFKTNHYWLHHRP